MVQKRKGLEDEAARSLLPGRVIVGVGPIRTATTWAFNVLSETGAVGYTRRKEIGYFDVNYQRGPNWYREQFANPELGIYVDFTPQYIDDMLFCQRLASDLPGANVVFGLRDPTQRLKSMFEMFYIGHGPEVDGCYEELFHRELSKQLIIFDRVKFLSDKFGDRMVVLDYEKLLLDSQSVASSLLKLCGLENYPIPAVSRLKINSLYETKENQIAQIGKFLFDSIKQFMPEKLRWKFRVQFGQKFFMNKVTFDQIISEERYREIVGPHLNVIINDARLVRELCEKHPKL